MTKREIRKNPFTGEWIIFSEVRQDRPDREKRECPLCTGSKEVPSFSKAMRIKNMYPALSSEEEFKRLKTGEYFEKMTGYGACELVVYTDDHNSKFISLDSDSIMQIFQVWMEATKDMNKDKNLKYILPFENFGSDVGATLIHPHGQIYAFPFVPNEMSSELHSIIEYREKHNKCMVCNYITKELELDSRIVFHDQNIIALIPYYSKYAYDVYFYPKRHYNFLHQSTRIELTSIASTIPKVINALNQIFGKEISYSLSLHQSPLNTPQSSLFHIYFKLHTPQRTHSSLKLLGAVETSTETFINGIFPENAAMKLRKFLM